MMTKQEKLAQLDSLVLDRMIKLIQTEETNLLAELSNAVSYLKANEVVEKRKETNDVVEERKKKLAEVKAKRDKQVR